MQADEAGTLAALKARRKEMLEPLVSRHHGRIFKIIGDGVLVEFASAVTPSMRRRSATSHGRGESDLPEIAKSYCASASTSATSWWKAAISMATA